MNIDQYTPVNQVIEYYKINIQFFEQIKEIGLVEIIIYEQTTYIHHNDLGDLEKIIRLHQDLGVNAEGIDIILNLLNKIESLQQKIT